VTSELGYPSFFALGYGGQTIRVIPKLDLVAVITSDPDQERYDARTSSSRRSSPPSAASLRLRPTELHGKSRPALGIRASSLKDPEAPVMYGRVLAVGGRPLDRFRPGGLAMQVRNLMRSPVVTVDPDQSLQLAAQVMQEHGIGSVVVEQGGQVAGILTERDVMHAAARLGDIGEARVADHMTAPVVTASPNWDVSVAAAEMHDRRIRHLVVLEQGTAAGVLSVRDVMSVFLPERVHRQEA
jgi:CBS domain-containing protein